jgi:hypothetical protein
MRECGECRASEDQIHSQAPASPVKAVPKFVSLPSKYSLPEHPIYPQTRTSNSTDESEFLRYKNAEPSKQETDLVAFWEVCTVFPPCC